MPTNPFSTLRALFLHPRFPIVIIISAIGIRLIWALLIQPTPVSDPAIYASRAMSIAAGEGYVLADGSPTAYWPVGYSAFLGLFIYLLGNFETALVISNCLLYSLLIISFFTLAKSTLTNTIAARLSLCLLAFYPDNIAYSSLATSELLASLLIISYLALIVNRKTIYHVVLSGIIIGYAALTKSQSILIPSIVCIFLLWSATEKQSRLNTLKDYGITMLVAMLVIAPWTVRNYSHFGEFIPISTNGGINLYIGNNPLAKGNYSFREQDKDLFKDLDEIQTNTKAKQLATDYIKNNPVTTVLRIPQKLYYLFRTDADGLSWNQEGLDDALFSSSTWRNLKIGATLYYYAILFLGMIAAILYLIRFIQRKAPPAAIYSLLIFYYIAIYGIFFGAPRFHDIFMPFLILTGSEILGRFWSKP